MTDTAKASVPTPGTDASCISRDIAARARALTPDDLPHVPRLDPDRERAARSAALDGYRSLTAYLADLGATRWQHGLGAWADVLRITGSRTSRRQAALRRLRRLEAFGLVRLPSPPGSLVVVEIDPHDTPSLEGCDTPSLDTTRMRSQGLDTPSLDTTHTRTRAPQESRPQEVVSLDAQSSERLSPHEVARRNLNAFDEDWRAGQVEAAAPPATSTRARAALPWLLSTSEEHR